MNVDIQYYKTANSATIHSEDLKEYNSCFNAKEDSRFHCTMGMLGIWSPSVGVSKEY